MVQIYCANGGMDALCNGRDSTDVSCCDFDTLNVSCHDHDSTGVLCCAVDSYNYLEKQGSKVQ